MTDFCLVALIVLCSPDWPQTHYVAEDDTEFFYLSASTFQVLRLQACNHYARFDCFFFFFIDI